jgi:hypothetical protein
VVVRCLRDGDPIYPVCAKCGYRSSESFVIWQGAIHPGPGNKIVADLAEEMQAIQEGREWERPPWPRRQLGSFIRRCRCGNDQELLITTVEQLVRNAAQQGVNTFTF